MKKMLVAAALVMLVAPAFAADYPRRPPMYADPLVAAPLFNWTGFYIGGHGGYGWGTGAGVSTSGFIGGGQLGFNYQLNGGLVLGAETDISISGIDGTAGGVTFGTDYLGSLRARVGYAVDRVLLYGTGGFGYGRGDLRIGGLSDKQTQWGWALGGGIEAMVAPQLSARIEYLYMDLGHDTYGSVIGPINVGFTTGLLRAGMNYKF
jgi:outer membrane immunogenic protein